MIREINFLKKVFAITIFTIFFSCSDDLVPVTKDKKELKFEWNTKTFDELKNNQKFSKSYNQVTEKISEKRNSVNGRTVMEDAYNFIIDSTSIYEVVAEGYTSYTFSIFRENQQNINYTYYENLFIEIDSTNIPQASILKYNLGSDHSVTSIESNKIIYNSNTAGKILYNGGDGDGCTTVTIYYVETCGCPGQHWPGDPTCTCYSSPPTSTFLNTYTSCPSSGPGGTTTTGVLTFHPNSSGGGSYSITSLSVSNPYSYVSQRRKSLKQTYPAGLTYNSAVYNWLMQQNETTQGAIYSYLESQVNLNGLLSTSTVYPQAAIEFINDVINSLMNGECVILPTVSEPSQITTAPFDQYLFGDYPEPATQQNHDAIQQQFNSLRNTNGDLAAVQYLINTYNMNSFGSNSVTFNYSISFANGLPTGDHANAIIGYNSSGNMVTCELQVDTNLLDYADFGYITRVIKHEIFHVLQAQFYGQNGLSNPAREFDAYYFQIFGFTNLKPIQDFSLVYGLAELMVENMNQMSVTEKNQRAKQINDFVKKTFPELCPN